MVPDAIDEAVARRLRSAGCVWAEDEARTLARASTSPAHLERMLERRCAGEPLEYVVGRAEFCGLEVVVEQGTFIPRRRSEYLAGCAVTAARKAQERAAERGRAASFLDMCCGTGAIAMVVSRRAPRVRLAASDVSEAAGACARTNLRGSGCRVFTGDLFTPLVGAGLDPFDVIVANTPYVPKARIATLPQEARRFEPRSSYDGGVDGLEIQRRLFEEAGRWLRADGCLLVETSRSQAGAAAGIAARCGFRVRVRESRAYDAAVVEARIA